MRHFFHRKVRQAKSGRYVITMMVVMMVMVMMMPYTRLLTYLTETPKAG